MTMEWQQIVIIVALVITVLYSARRNWIHYGTHENERLI